MHTFNYHPDQDIDYFHSPRSIAQIIFKLKHKYSSKERIFSFTSAWEGWEREKGGEWEKKG